MYTFNGRSICYKGVRQLDLTIHDPKTLHMPLTETQYVDLCKRIVKLLNHDDRL